jgi:hypothetical protein
MTSDVKAFAENEKSLKTLVTESFDVKRQFLTQVLWY